MNTAAYKPGVELIELLTAEQAWHYGVVPESAADSCVHLLIDELKLTPSSQEELEMLLGKTVQLTAAPAEFIRNNLGKYYLRNSAARDYKPVSKSLAIRQNDDFLPAMISEAKNLGSSDIHIETFEEKARVRMRIDGLLVERMTVSKGDYPALVNKIKIKANLDISEKRLPQDGRIFFQNENLKFDIRVSVLPTLHGEKIVLRLLNNDATDIDISTLGMSDIQLRNFLSSVRKPHGILLISGPTGSGKTTTLYATLKLLNKSSTNIVTVEDPVEYTLEGINQVQLKESIGLNFASALRTFLRQDPDIIMLGEIRDVETAQMAVRAALTGHLVLSTIHTNSAWGTVARLCDMGVPPFLIANTLNATVAQRLVRVLCPHCKKATLYHNGMLPGRPEFSGEVFEPAGCERCHFTGYRGRKAIYEVVPVDEELCDYIKTMKPVSAAIYDAKEISTLAASAWALVRNGETSCDEIYAIVSGTIN